MKPLKLGCKKKGVELEPQIRLAEPHSRIERIIFRTADKSDRHKAFAGERSLSNALPQGLNYFQTIARSLSSNLRKPYMIRKIISLLSLTKTLEVDGEMSFQFGYLTPKQRKLWGLRRRGLTEAEISREMAVTRQTVNKTFNVIDSKVSRALLEAAEINRIEVRRVNPERGFLLGFSPIFGMEVLVTLSERNGIQVWYRGEGGCSKCSWLSSCRQKLLTEAQERGIPLPEDADAMEPSRLSEILFEKITED